VMKHISEKFTEDEFKQIEKSKGDRSWRKFILDAAGVEQE